MDTEATNDRELTTEDAIHNYGWYAIEVARMLRRYFDQDLAASDLDISPGEARTLSFAASFPQERQFELAERMGFNPMTVVGHLDSLEEKGLVRRQVDPRDRRANVVVVTTLAEPVLERIAAMSGAIRNQATADFSSEERSTLERLLQRLCDAYVAMGTERDRLESSVS